MVSGSYSPPGPLPGPGKAFFERSRRTWRRIWSHFDAMHCTGSGTYCLAPQDTVLRTWLAARLPAC